MHALDGLRGLAALAVVVLHVWMHTDANRPEPGRTDLLDRVIGELRIAVVRFFVRSGFLPAIAWVLPLTLALATASWFLIERPAIARSGRALPKRPLTAEPAAAPYSP